MTQGVPGERPLADRLTVNVDGCAVDDLSFCGLPMVSVPADTGWDAFVAHAVESGWVGIELLSGLPGTVADVVTHNGGAHGQRVSDTVASVRTWDTVGGRQRTFAAADCGFVADGSRFLPASDEVARFRIIDVAFLFRQGDLTAPIDDDRLVAELGVAVGERVPLAQARNAALGLADVGSGRDQ